ncbi:MAG: class IV adenylate cyclase [Candidatus Omnitrophota bacterium]
MITFGKRIKELCAKQRISSKQLAKRSGIEQARVRNILSGYIESVEPEELLKITDCIDLSLQEFIYLQKLNSSPRKFQAYCVGIPKTGTTSIKGIFSGFRSLHEMMFKETAGKLMDFKKRNISKLEFTNYLRSRDSKALVEMDSASFNYFYLDFLKREFPEAKFIFTIRDCYSWADSVLNMYLNGASAKADWMRKYTSFFLGVNFSVISDEDRLKANFEEVIDKLLRYWASANEMILKKLPKDRSLIIRTHELTEKINDIAEFVGVDRKKMSEVDSHLFKTGKEFNMIKKMNSKALEKKFNKYCSVLMRKFFPEFSYKRHLDRAGAKELEYEIKFKIQNKEGILAKLKKLEEEKVAKDLGKEKETDIYMRFNDKVVRIRKTGRGGLITTKEIIPTKERAKVRKETQTEVADAGALIDIFKGIGFKELKRIEKIRHTFRFNQGSVLVDRLPFMGYYVEIEAGSFKKMTGLAKKLGFDHNAGLTNSYLNMFVGYIIKNAGKFKDSKTDILPLFAKEREFKNKQRRYHGGRKESV